MPRWVATILDSSAASLIGRVLLALPFLGSGISKVFDWNAAVGEMAHFNLNPPTAFAAATLMVQLVGSLLVIWGPYAWLGAGMLGVFTALTIPIAHRFWTMSGPAATTEMYVAVEHIALIGGLILVAVLRRRETHRR